MPVIFEQKKFDKGEVSPSFLGRSDLDSYKGAVSKLENGIITEVGSVQKRPGFTRIATLGDEAYELVPFQFNIDQSYIVAISNSDIKIFSGTNLVSTISPSPFSVGIRDIKTVQSGDVLYIVDRDMFPQRLIRRAHDDWIIENDVENFWEYEVVPLSWGGGANLPQPMVLLPPADIRVSFSPEGGNIRETSFNVKIAIASAHSTDIVVAVVNTVNGTASNLGNLTISAGSTESSNLSVTPVLVDSGPTNNVISGTVTSPSLGTVGPDSVTFVNREIPADPVSDIRVTTFPEGGNIRNVPFDIKATIASAHSADIVVAYTNNVNTSVSFLDSVTITAGQTESGALTVTPLLVGGIATNNVISGNVTSPVTGTEGPANVTFVNRPAVAEENVRITFSPEGGSVRETDIDIKITIAEAVAFEIVIGVFLTQVDGFDRDLGDLTIPAGSTESSTITFTPQLVGSGPTNNMLHTALVSPITGTVGPANVNFVNRARPE